MSWTGPVLDNHLHLGGSDGRGLAAVDDFVASGGTHLIVINKPSWWYGVAVEDRADFRVGYDATVEIVNEASERLPGRAWAVLGVHPGLISRLVDDRGMTAEAAESIMRSGIDLAAEYVDRNEALGIKSGRPHYPVDDAVWEASNAVMRAAFDYAAALGCPVQLHTEGGDAFSDIADWASEAGMHPEQVVKHYADGPIEGPTPSVIARKDALERAVAADEPFLMETDYLDDPDRPGAVLGPKTVPRRVSWLAENGHEDAIERAHVRTPERIYGIELDVQRDP